MGNGNCENTAYCSIIYKIKRLLSLYKKNLKSEKEIFKEMMEIFELVSMDFDSMKKKLNPSNVQIFSSITDSLLAMQEYMDITGMMVSFIEHEIQLMDYLIDSSFENLIRMFPYSVNRLLNRFMELLSKRKQGLDILQGITDAIKIIYES